MQTPQVPAMQGMTPLGIAANEAPAVTGAYRTAATSQGAVDGRVSSQWANRPDDEKFLSLHDLHKAVLGRVAGAREFDFDPRQMQVGFDNGGGLTVAADGTSMVNPTHWSFGQLCSLVKCPADYLRRLPPKLAAINLQHGAMAYDGNGVKAYQAPGKLMAATGTGYGRIYDYQVVEEVMKVAGNGTGDTRWKVPGLIDWRSQENGTVLYNPFVDVTKETTTLYASDRDVFIFLCDDTHPIEIGKLPNGEPDLLFRGFIVWNSEVGSKSFGMTTMLLRGVCCNRNLWGVEGTQEVRIRHSSMAPKRFAQDVSPMLAVYSDSSPMGIVNKVTNAKNTIVARTDEERVEFLTGRADLAKPLADRVLEAVLNEELHPAQSVWDMVQGMTAVARRYGHQDARLDLERKAGKLMDKIAA